MSDLRHKPDERWARNKLVVRLLSEQCFSQCRESWNSLLDESYSESFFLKWEWIYTYWKTIDKKDTSLLVCFCYDNSDLVGIAPLYVYKCTFLGLPVRKIAFLGDHVASDYMDIFASPGYEQECCREVVNFFQSKSLAEFSMFEFDGICADSNIYRCLAVGNNSSENVVALPRFECPRTMLAQDFDTYIGNLSSSARYDVRRKQRKLERSVNNLVVRNLDLTEHPHLLDVLFDLHAKRWDMIKERNSTFSSSFRKVFNRELLECLKSGEGFFSYVTVDGKPASIMYIFLYKSNAYFYQNGWSPEYASCSIGIYNIQQAVRFAIEKGCHSFDFLRGPERYKYSFCNDIRQAYVVLLFAPSLSGRYLKRFLLLKIGLKNLLNRCGLLNFGRSIISGIGQLNNIIK